jgi:hypothetical protein
MTDLQATLAGLMRKNEEYKLQVGEVCAFEALVGSTPCRCHVGLSCGVGLSPSGGVDCLCMGCTPARVVWMWVTAPPSTCITMCNSL